MCIVRIQCVRLNFECKERLFNLLDEATINTLIAHPSVRCAFFPLKNKHIPFSRSVGMRCMILKRLKNESKKILEISFVLEGFVPDKSVSLSINVQKNDEKCYECMQRKTCRHLLHILFKYQKPMFLLFGGDVTYCLSKSWAATSRTKNHLHICRFFSANLNQTHPNLTKTKAKVIPLIAQSCRLLVGWWR